jgi:hypothetical protein
MVTFIVNRLNVVLLWVGGGAVSEIEVAFLKMLGSTGKKADGKSTSAREGKEPLIEAVEVSTSSSTKSRHTRKPSKQFVGEQAVSGGGGGGGKLPPEDDFTYDVCMVFKIPDQDKQGGAGYDEKQVVVDLIGNKKVPAVTAAMIVESLQRSGLKCFVFFSRDRSEVYCLIGATEARLEQEAARIDYDLLLSPEQAIEYGASKGVSLAKAVKQKHDPFGDKKHFELISRNLWKNIYAPYVPELRQLYVKYPSTAPTHRGSIFKTIDRIKLTTSVIEADAHVGGADICK